MTKRLREDLAAKAGLKSYETVEGRAWLMKVLNPADVSQRPSGVPSQDFHNTTCLNWQNDYDITAPPSVSAQVPAFDVDLFLNQNPLLFGVSLASPSGTMDISQVSKLQLQWGGTASTVDGTIDIVPADAPEKSVALRVSKQLVNTQLNGQPYYQSNSISSRRLMFSTLAQKSKIMYASAHIIPTCSELNNGGAISCCQQVCQPRTTPLSVNNSIFLASYTNSDFPDVSDTIQNPQMYYSRFYDGLYAPYKIRDAANQQYIPTENEVTTRSPYAVTKVSALGVTAFTDVNNYTISEVDLDFVPSTTSTAFSINNLALSKKKFYCTANNRPLVLAIRFSITTFTGQRGYIDFTIQNTTARTTSSFYTNDSLTVPIPSLLLPQELLEGVYTSASDPSSFSISTAGILLAPEMVTMYQANGETGLENPWGSWFYSQDIVTGNQYTIDKSLLNPTIPMNVGTNMITVHMTGVSSTAPIKLTIRFGLQIQLTAGSLYTCFKEISPKYDESAIKSQIRCSRVMRDAYFANAGTPMGQPDFILRLRNLIDYDSSDDMGRILNQGGSYQGSIGG